jgi:hypothetical protein
VSSTTRPRTGWTEFVDLWRAQYGLGACVTIAQIKAIPEIAALLALQTMDGREVGAALWRNAGTHPTLRPRRVRHSTTVRRPRGQAGYLPLPSLWVLEEVIPKVADQ